MKPRRRVKVEELSRPPRSSHRFEDRLRRCRECGSALCPAAVVGGVCRDRRFLDMVALRRMFGLGPATIKRLVAKRVFPVFRIGHKYFVDRATLEAWLATIQIAADPKRARLLPRMLAVQYTCLRCGFQWRPRYVGRAPCPRCLEIRWDEPPTMPLDARTVPWWFRRRNPLMPDSPTTLPPATPTSGSAPQVVKRQADPDREPEVIDPPDQ